MKDNKITLCFKLEIENLDVLENKIDEIKKLVEEVNSIGLKANVVPDDSK